MVFGKKRLIVYLQKSSLELIGPHLESQEKIDFPKDTFRDLQLKDKNQFRESIIIFLAKTSLPKHKITLILSKDLLFEETVPFTDRDKVKEQATAFFNSLPLNAEQIANEMLANDKEVYLYATNREIYSIIIDAFSSIGWDVDTVIPVTLLEVKEQTITRELAQKILKDKSLIKTGDLLVKNQPLAIVAPPIDPKAEKGADTEESDRHPLLQEEVEEEKTIEKKPEKEEKKSKAPEVKEEKPQKEQEKLEEKEASHVSAGQKGEEEVKKAEGDYFIKSDSFEIKNEKKGFPKQYLFYAFLIFLVVVGAVGGWQIYSRIQLRSSIEKDLNTVDVAKKAKVTPTQIPTPTVVGKPKENLKVEIQNGTGTPGQAKKVQGIVSDLGYKQIEAKNAESTDNADTIVSFSPNISSSDKQELLATLKKTFKKVVSKDLPESSTSDILIVTGAEL